LGVELALTPSTPGGGGDGDGDGDGDAGSATPPGTPGTPGDPTGGGTPAGTGEAGTVAGVEFEEGLAQAPTDQIIDEIPEVEVEVSGSTAADTTEPDEEATASNCALYIWIFLALNVLAAGFAWQRGRNEPNVWKKNLWLIGLIIALIPLAIWYPDCWLWVWLLVTFIAISGGALMLGKKSQAPPSSTPIQ
jgi:hypothetical protein